MPEIGKEGNGLAILVNPPDQSGELIPYDDVGKSSPHFN
jgi:hypothetical protein